MRKIIFLIVTISLSNSLIGQNSDQIESRFDTLAQTVSGLNEPVDFTTVDAPLEELLRAVAETHQLNINLNRLPGITITNNFNGVLVKDLMVYLCQEYDLGVRFNNNIFTFYQNERVVEKVPMVRYNSSDQLVSFELNNAQLNEFAREFTSITDNNLLINRNLDGFMASLYLEDLSIEVALNTLAESLGLILTKKADKVYQLSQNEQGGGDFNSYSQFNNDRFAVQTYVTEGNKFVSIKCKDIPSEQLLTMIGNQLGIDYIFLSQIQGTINCSIDSVLFEDFLNLSLESSNLSYSISSSGIYVIGESANNGLNETKVFSFKNRTVEGVIEIMPQSMTSKVQLQTFNDLNALIITGSDVATEKVMAFLKQIDLPVPNVLIEVIMAEVRKGSSLQTGLKAFIGDSVPPTSGQVFGGVDVTINPASFNKILSNLDGRGIMNLGRVTPQFYATLQAMESNNNLDMQSTPKLSTLNGHEASMRIGQSVYYLIETQNVTGGVNPIVTVTPQYENVEANLDLKITPFVSQHEDVTLTIEVEFSDFIAPTTEGAPPGNATRKFTSKIRVKNEETVVMGGLEERSKIDSGSGTPFLSRVPILKWIFSSRNKEDTDGKLMIFIKPTIVY